MKQLNEEWWKATNHAHEEFDSKQAEIHSWDWYAKFHWQELVKAEKKVEAEY